MVHGRARQYIKDRRADGTHPTDQAAAAARPRQYIILKILKVLGAAVSLIAMSLGIASGYLSLLPRISVTQTEPLNVTDPFASPFIVSNDGPMGINGVEFYCVLVHVRTRKGFSFDGITTELTALNQKHMEPGERVSVPCSFRQFFGFTTENPVIGAEIIVGVTFRPDFVWVHKNRQFRFVAMADSHSDVRWYPQSSLGPTYP